MSIDSVLSVKAKTSAPLDPNFQPAILVHRAYQEAVAALPESSRLVIALERTGGYISRIEFPVAPAGSSLDADTLRYAERIVKFLLWAWGGWKVYVGGPAFIGEHIRKQYTEDGARAFDVDMMKRAYEETLEVVVSEADAVPDTNEMAMSVGGHLDGCRIGFDLGASDYKLAAVKDGEAVFSTEIPWDPKNAEYPEYHYDKIQAGLKMAAGHLPEVDAIGGSSAGIYVNDRPMVASLFRSIPIDQFESFIKPMFERIQKEWDVPLAVINDGDVTALAGAMSLKKDNMLGIAMGSSEAVGFMNKQGRITGWLNELAFAPVDFNPEAEADEWSGDIGVGAMYFSQQAVNKLAPAAGMSFPDDVDLPERLKAVQEKADTGDEAAAMIFESIGIYLGYAIPWYAVFYDFDDLLILGRVTSGRGGEIILEKAREVMQNEFPEEAARITIHVPDEKSRRVGRAVAAASLPER